MRVGTGIVVTRPTAHLLLSCHVQPLQLGPRGPAPRPEPVEFVIGVCQAPTRVDLRESKKVMSREEGSGCAHMGYTQINVTTITTPVTDSQLSLNTHSHSQCLHSVTNSNRPRPHQRLHRPGHEPRGLGGGDGGRLSRQHRASIGRHAHDHAALPDPLWCHLGSDKHEKLYP